MRRHRYSRWWWDAKRKSLFSSDSKLAPDADWNESKRLSHAASERSIAAGLHGHESRLPASSIAVAASCSATTVTSRDIASAAIERIARTIGLGMVTAEPAGEAPAASAGVGPVGSSAVGRRPATTAPVLQPRHQHIANQRSASDRNYECHHRAHRNFL